MVDIRDEAPTDVGAREALLDRAFEVGRAAKTCERLREGRVAADGLSLAAWENGRLIGTLRFWHVALGAGCAGLMLGPLAVDCDARGDGVGAALMEAGLTRAKSLGHEAVILVRDAPYYERFGFGRDVTEALAMPGPIERERFLGVELKLGALSGAAGLVRPTGAIAFASKRRGLSPAGRRAA